MTFSATVEVVGLKEALKELNQVDKRLRREITRDYQKIVDPIKRDANAELNSIGNKPPLSGWNRAWDPRNARADLSDPVRRMVRETRLRLEAEGRITKRGGVFPWDTDQAKRMVKAKINTRQPRQFAGATRNLAVFTLSWLGAANQVFELAGRASGGKTPQGKQMIQALNERYGRPGRIIWRAYDKSRDEVDKEMRQLVERVMAQVNRKAIFSQRAG